MNSSAQLIRSHEGLRLDVYLDSQGIRTVGYGHQIRARGVLATAVATITAEGAERLFESDLAHARDVAADWIDDAPGRLPVEGLNAPRFAALVDMAFNLGAGGLAKFVKLRAALVERDYERAAVEMLDSEWAAQVGRRARVDAALMRDGAWPRPDPPR